MGSWTPGRRLVVLKVLGIDPGSIVTGYGIVERGAGGRLVHIAHGEISVSASLPLAERLFVISEALNKVIDAYNPEAVSVESVFYAKNVKSAVMLGHARGVSLLSASSFGLPVFEYAPMAIKKSVTGYGAAAKDQVQKMVRALLKTTETPPPDAADALAVAICHIHHFVPGVRRVATQNTGTKGSG